MKRLSVTVDDGTESKLNKIAKKMDRTISDTFRQIIKEYEINE